MVEQIPLKDKVEGSSPSGRTKEKSFPHLVILEITCTINNNF